MLGNFPEMFKVTLASVQFFLYLNDMGNISTLTLHCEYIRGNFFLHLYDTHMSSTNTSILRATSSVLTSYYEWSSKESTVDVMCNSSALQVIHELYKGTKFGFFLLQCFCILYGRFFMLQLKHCLPTL